MQKTRTLVEIIDAAADVDNIPMEEYRDEEVGFTSIYVKIFTLMCKFAPETRNALSF